MAMASVRILAINPGSRYVGFAVFRDGDIRDWGVRVLPPGSPSAKRKAFRDVIQKVVRTHSVDTLILKSLHPSRSSDTLDSLVRESIAIAKAQKLSVHRYSVDAVKLTLSSSAKTNRRGLMEIVASRFPFLYSEFERERNSRNAYRIRMFEAVALGMTFLKNIE